MLSRAGLQAINDPLVESFGYTNSVLDAAFTGGVANNCLRFNAAGVVSNFFTETTTANDGTTIACSQPGIYACELVTSQVDGVTNIWGISIGANAVVSGTVVNLTNGVIKAAQQITLLNETRSNVIVGIVQLRLVAAKATIALQSANQFRGVASASGGGAPTGVVAANVSLRILKINDFWA